MHDKKLSAELDGCLSRLFVLILIAAVVLMMINVRAGISTFVVLFVTGCLLLLYGFQSRRSQDWTRSAWHWKTAGAYRSGAGKSRPAAADPAEERPAAPPECLRILGLDTPATLEEVKRAFREKAKAAHPDAGGDDEAFIRLQAAYEEALQLAPRRRQPLDPFETLNLTRIKAPVRSARFDVYFYDGISLTEYSRLRDLQPQILSLVHAEVTGFLNDPDVVRGEHLSGRRRHFSGKYYVAEESYRRRKGPAGTPRYSIDVVAHCLDRPGNDRDQGPRNQGSLGLTIHVGVDGAEMRPYVRDLTAPRP